MRNGISISTQSLQRVYGDIGALDIAKKLGVDAVDFFTNCYFCEKPDSVYSKSDREIYEYFLGIKRHADSLGLAIGQTHGRLRIFWNDEKKDKYCLENARLDVLAAKALGAPVCVMHGMNSSVFKVVPKKELLYEMVALRFEKILSYSNEYGVDIAMETSGFMDSTGELEYFAPASNFKDFYGYVKKNLPNSERFKICVDTGHVNTAVRFGNPTPADFIRLCKGDIAAVHLHDNPGDHDMHLPMLCGNIDWADVFSALREINFEGYYNLEVDFDKFGAGLEYDTAEFSIKILLNILKRLGV